jgi:hypothetical protein
MEVIILRMSLLPTESDVLEQGVRGFVESQGVES